MAEQVNILAEDLAERFRYQPRSSYLRGHAISYTAIDDIMSEETPPAGIYGVGATVADDEVVPAVFVVPSLATRTLGPPPVAEPVRHSPAAAVIAHYAGHLPTGLLVVPLSPPVEQAGPVRVGGELSAAGVRGTCGVAVRSSGSAPAVLTAGHVAKQVRARATAGGQAVGWTVRTDYLALHRPGEVVADVAVIELDPGVQVTNPRKVTGEARAGQFDAVVIDGQSGPEQAWIRSVVSSFALSQKVGVWGEVLITDRAASAAGDSGAPVYLADSPGAVVGHVVAGSHSYTLVQDIAFLLKEADSAIT
ncbi:MAG: hypothetical protein AUI14_13990 [Actinobacteria bacterium 13_2_20CM_2_71_6]|nr:MAG: hypothetical protein AUI14_13990 [Actinobacteria bacterium 13_2_20CM_2_71_6]